MAAPGFWDDTDRAWQAVDEFRRVKRWTEPFADLSQRTQEALELAGLVAEESDADVERGLAEEVEQLLSGVRQLELQNMLQGADDRRSALVTIHPGAGGTESQDWAEMLMRMYTRWV